jgi:hypothetical protein
MAGLLTLALGLALFVGGSVVGIDLVAHAGAAIVALSLWMVVASRF